MVLSCRKVQFAQTVINERRLPSHRAIAVGGSYRSFFSRIGSFDVFSAACVERIISELIRTYGRGAPATTDWFTTAIRYRPRRR